MNSIPSRNTIHIIKRDEEFTEMRKNIFFFFHVQSTLLKNMSPGNILDQQQEHSIGGKGLQNLQLMNGDIYIYTYICAQ